MREIKFRAWDKSEEAMSAPFQIFDTSFCYMRMPDVYMATITDLDSGEFDLMQFTGFLDKNGKEIYEGDIVKHSIYSKDEGETYEGVYQVAWKDAAFELQYKTGGLASLLGGDEKECEIIGNIYENYELLK